MRVVVTGGLGFLGSAVVKGLIAAGHDVRIFDDASRGARRNLEELRVDVAVIDGDVRDVDALHAALRGAEVVIHLAAVQGTGTFYRAPHRVLDVNVAGALNAARACARDGVRRLVFASSSEVYGAPAVVPTPETMPLVIPDVLNPRFSYAASKIVGELVTINFARQHGFEYTVLRPHNVYGPRMGWDHVIPQFIARLERGEEFTVQGDGTQTRAFCYIDDAVDATARASVLPEAANEIFNVGNPREEHSISALIELLAVISGKPIRPRHVAPAEGGVLRRSPDITRIRERLGFEPKVSLREGLAETYRWYAGEIRRGAAEASLGTAAR